MKKWKKKAWKQGYRWRPSKNPRLLSPHKWAREAMQFLDQRPIMPMVFNRDFKELPTVEYEVKK